MKIDTCDVVVVGFGNAAQAAAFSAHQAGAKVIVLEKAPEHKLPLEQLLKIVTIKILCRETNVEKVEAGPKGIVMHFRDRAFANVFSTLAFTAHMLGERRLYAVAARQCLPD